MTVHPHLNIEQEAYQVAYKIGSMKAEIEDIRSDVKELKESSREVLKFVHEYKGGKAWFAGMMGASAVAGGLILSLIQAFTHIFFPPKF